MKYQKDAGKECVICTWWRPGGPDEQPMLQVKKFVGSALEGPHVTEIVFLKNMENYVKHIWSLVPATSFLRHGLQKSGTVLRFEVDEIDVRLENAITV